MLSGWVGQRQAWRCEGTAPNVISKNWKQSLFLLSSRGRSVKLLKHAWKLTGPPRKVILATHLSSGLKGTYSRQKRVAIYVHCWDTITEILTLADILPLQRPLQVSFTAYVVFSELNIFLLLQLQQRAMVGQLSYHMYMLSPVILHFSPISPRSIGKFRTQAFRHRPPS